MDKETAKEEAKEIAIAQLNKRNTETVEVVLRIMQKEITDLKIGIPFISSLPSQVDVFVEPLLSANVNGSPAIT